MRHPRRHSRRRNPAAQNNLVEPLERRRLFSASLIGQVLTVQGTGAADNMTVDIVGSAYRVDVNGDVQDFALADVGQVVIEGFGGSDFIVLRAAQHQVNIDGGTAGDQVHLALGGGSDLSRITQQVICDGAAGSNDLISLWDNGAAAPVDPAQYRYTVTNDTIDRAGSAGAGSAAFGGVRYENFEFIDITGTTHHDDFYITALLEGVHLRAFGLDGFDTMYVGSTGDGGFGDLDNVRGSVFFNGQYDGFDTVILDDAFSDNPADSYVIADEFVTRPGTLFGGLEYWAERLIIDAPAGDNHVRVDGIDPDSAVTVYGGAGNDSITAGAGAIAGQGNLDRLRGPLTFRGEDGNDSATLDDSGSLLGRSFILDTDSLVVQEGFGAQFRGLYYFDTESITLHGSQANGNSYNIWSFSAGGTFTAIGGAGSESFAVGTGAVDVEGALVFNGGGGESIDFLVIQDGDNPFDDDYAVTANTVSRTLFGGVTYEGFESLQLYAGAGSNVIQLNGIGAGTQLAVHAGAGDDQVHVAAQSLNLDALPGVLSISGGEGVDGLNIDDGLNPQHAFWDFLPGSVTRDRENSDVDTVVAHDAFESLAVRGGSGVDTFQVFETDPGVPLSIAPGESEWDNVLVYSAAPDAPVSVLPGSLDGPYVSVNMDQTGATVLFPEPIRLNGLHVAAGGIARVPAGVGGLFVKNVLGIAAGGMLDLADNDLIFDYAADDPSPLGISDGTTYSGLTGLIQSARNGGTWDGAGIGTSMADAVTGLTTLGIAEAGQVLAISGGQTGTFNGQTVDSTAILIKYTYTGDANLDGMISGDDYGAIDFAFGIAGAFGYANGDFNLDGFISADDYSAIDFNLVAQGMPL